MIRMYTSGNSINLQNPVIDNVFRTQKYQTLGRTIGGKVYVYTKGTTKYQMDLTFENLRESEKVDLAYFFDTTVGGMSTTFNYTDHMGKTWTARFIEDELQWNENDNNKDPVAESVVSAGQIYPSRRFSKGIYSVSIKLEVS